MGNLLDIQMQIEKLQKQASEIKDREFDKTVQDIRDKMKAFGITAKDLQVAPAGRKGRGKALAKPKPRLRLQVPSAKLPVPWLLPSFAVPMESRGAAVV